MSRGLAGSHQSLEMGAIWPLGSRFEGTELFLIDHEEDTSGRDRQCVRLGTSFRDLKATALPRHEVHGQRWVLLTERSTLAPVLPAAEKVGVTGCTSLDGQATASTR